MVNTSATTTKEVDFLVLKRLSKGGNSATSKPDLSAWYHGFEEIILNNNSSVMTFGRRSMLGSRRTILSALGMMGSSIDRVQSAEGRSGRHNQATQ